MPPKSILKKSDNIYISEAERELRGSSSHGVASYGDIVFGYQDGQLVEMPCPPVEEDDMCNVGYASESDRSRRGSYYSDDEIDYVGGNGRSTHQHAGASIAGLCVNKNEERRNKKKEEDDDDDDDDAFKFDASFSAFDEEVTGKGNDVAHKQNGEVPMSLFGLSSLPSLGGTTTSTGGSRSLARGMDERRRRQEDNACYYDDNEHDEGYCSEDHDNDRRARRKKKESAEQRVRETRSAYTVSNPNMAAKRRAAERRAKVGAIRDATAHSGDKNESSNAALPPPELRRARSDDATRGSASKSSNSRRRQSIEPERPSKGARHRCTDSRREDAHGSGQMKKSTISALVSANAQRGAVVEKYRRNAQLIAAEQGDDSFRSTGGGSQSTAQDSFRSARSSSSTHRSATSRGRDGTTSARSLGSTTSVRDGTISARSLGSTTSSRRHHRRSSSSARERELTARTSAKSSSRRRASDIISPSTAGGSAEDSFTSANSSKISVSSLSARIRQREILGAGCSTDSGRRVVSQGTRRRPSSNDASSLEDGLSGDSHGSTGSVGFNTSAELSAGSPNTGASQSLGSRSTKSEKKAYSSKAARMHIRDAVR